MHFDIKVSTPYRLRSKSFFLYVMNNDLFIKIEYIHYSKLFNDDKQQSTPSYSMYLYNRLNRA
jgi:hypothetical protein